MRNFQEILDSNEFVGIDIDLETSLYEYGFIYKFTDDTKEEIFYYYICGFDKEENLDLFGTSFMTKKEYKDLLLCKEWADEESIDSFLSFTGNTLEEQIKQFPIGVSDLIQYWGENITGTDYYPTTIKNNN